MKVTKATIVRTILVLLVIINFCLKKCGLDVIPTDESVILMFVETGIEVAIIAVGFWKNNSYSEKAIEADNFLRQLREGEQDHEFTDRTRVY